MTDMQVKNPSYNSVGTIDCEINHPSFGWIPFTASPDDSESLGKEVYAKVISGDYGPIAEYVAPPEVVFLPSVVTMRQARRALLAEGKLSKVQTAIEELPSPQREIAQIDWEYSQEVRKDWPFVQMLAPILEIDLDDLFLKASKL